MIENIILRFQNRWQTIIAVLILLLASSPTPLHGAGYSALNRASISLQSGQVEDALMDIERALTVEPALAGLNLIASDLAYALEDIERSSQYVEAAKQQRLVEEIGFCRQARIELNVEPGKTIDPDWEQFIRECDFAYPQTRAKILERFNTDPAEYLLPFLEQLYLTNPEEISVQSAYASLLAVSEPALAVEKLRSLSSRPSQENALERDLLIAIRSAEPEGSLAFTYAQIGQVFARYQQWSLAKLAFQHALSEEPKYVDALAYLGLSNEQLGFDGSSEISAAIEANPQNPRFYVFLAIHHLNQNEIELARQALDQAARLDPQNPAIAAQLGSVYAEIGDFSAGTQAYLAATDLAPNDSRFWLLLAGYSLEYDLDLKELALPAARNAVSVDPDNQIAYEMLARIQFELEMYSLAERSLRTALRIDPESPSAQYMYGLLMLNNGQREAANAAFLATIIFDDAGQYAQLAARLLD